jgi:hypothetical protein
VEGILSDAFIKHLLNYEFPSFRFKNIKYQTKWSYNDSFVNLVFSVEVILISWNPMQHF